MQLLVIVLLQVFISKTTKHIHVGYFSVETKTVRSLSCSFSELFFLLLFLCPNRFMPPSRTQEGFPEGWSP